MVVYKYLGYGETDESGVAHLEYDADGEPLDPVGYTGVGAGEIDFIASLDNPMTSGSIVSGTLPVFDCYKYDNATLSDHNDIWLIDANRERVTRYEEYTLLEEVASSNAQVYFSSIPQGDYKIEFDIYQLDGNNYNTIFQVLDTNWTQTGFGNISQYGGTLNNWTHISYDATVTTDNSKFRIMTGAECTKLQFKNFKMYPI